MAKCDLSIKLDDPDKVYPGGGKITGTVFVRADADVRCKGLEVYSGWSTHGRGNVAEGVAEQITVFDGEWKAGQSYDYRFELTVADWPPSYHGHYLNVDHHVSARAKIPWAFDPKAAAPFLMYPTCGAEGAEVTQADSNVSGTCGCIIIGAVIAVFVGVFGTIAVATFPFGLIAVVGVVLISFLYWFIRVFLPKYLLGEVQCEMDDLVLTPGSSGQGQLVLRPRKNVPVNEIRLHLSAREQVVHGSGSNRTTHRNVFFEKTEVLQEATTLSAGVEQRFDLNIQLPDDAPYSIDLNDNDLVWSAEIRIDIPRWPDWKKDVKLTVVPGEGKTGQPAESTSGKQAIAQPVPPEPASAAGGEITFAETASHLYSVRQDREQVDQLAEAVSGLTFSLEAIVERRLLYGGEEDPHFYKDGYAVWARFTDPPLPMVLYVPHDLADEFEQIGRDVWRGQGTIVGWDSQHGRLQVRLERP